MYGVRLVSMRRRARFRGRLFLERHQSRLRLLLYPFLFLGILPPPLQAQEQPAQLEWVRTFDSGSFDIGNDVSVDSQGSVIAVGLSLIPGRMSSNPTDLRVLKFTNSGDLLWNITFDGGGPDSALGVDTDSSGNIYVAATSQPGPSTPFVCRVMKLSPDGGVMWNKTFLRTDAVLSEGCFDVAVDTAANVLLLGEVVASALPYNSDLWLFKLDSNGNPLWDRLVDSSTGSLVGIEGNEQYLEMDAGPDGSVYVASEELLLNHLGNNQFKFVSKNVLVARIDPDGNSAFLRLLEGGSNIPSELGVAVDAVGQERVGGLDGGYFFFGKVSPTGDQLARMARRLTAGEFGLGGGIYYVDTSRAVSDAQGNFYLTGDDLGDLVLLKQDPDGQPLWGQTLPVAGGYAAGGDVEVDSNGNIYLAGTDGNFTLPGALDIVVAKYRQAAPTTLSVTLQPAGVFPGGATQAIAEARDPSGRPKAGVDVTFTAEPVAGSGGHDHDGARPVGMFSGSNILFSSLPHGRTGPDGKLTATYTAGVFGGQETIKVHVTDTPSISTAAVLEVRERDLAGRVFVSLPSSPGIYVKDGGTAFHHGPGCTQAAGCDTPDQNHFGRLEVVQAMVAIATEWQETHPKLEINDISLSHGGAFDICGTWNVAGTCADTPSGGHIAHRLGRGVDFQIAPGLSPSKLPFGDSRRLRNLIISIGGRKTSIRPYKDIRAHWHVDFNDF